MDPSWVHPNMSSFQFWLHLCIDSKPCPWLERKKSTPLFSRKIIDSKPPLLCSHVHFPGLQTMTLHAKKTSHVLSMVYIYLHEWLIFYGKCIGTQTIHGWCGMCLKPPNSPQAFENTEAPKQRWAPGATEGELFGREKKPVKTQQHLPSRKLTKPTWGKGKSSSNMPYQRDMLHMLYNSLEGTWMSGWKLVFSVLWLLACNSFMDKELFYCCALCALSSVRSSF